MGFSEHPLRRALVTEMHLRSFTPVSVPARLIQIVRVVDPEDRSAEIDYLSQLPGADMSNFKPDNRHVAFRLDESISFIWERQTEATTITAIASGSDENSLDGIAERMLAWPGQVVRATKIFIESSDKAAEAILPKMQFLPEDLVTCHLRSDVRIWSDFRIREDGFGRLVLSAKDVSADELGRTVQQLQELGNYRNLALLGLPPVREAMPQLDALEKKLADHSIALSEEKNGSDDTLLQNLSQLSAELAQMRAANSFRYGATQAYAQIVSDRLETLDVRPIRGFQSLRDFTERRLVPAVRTCNTFSERLRRLSDRAGDVISLLNTRIDSRIRKQNLSLLKSMERSTSLQLRLQRLVEGLSIIAAAYYAVGLISYIVKGGLSASEGLSLDLILGLVVLPVMLVIYLFIKKRRGKSLADFNERE